MNNLGIFHQNDLNYIILKYLDIKDILNIICLNKYNYELVNNYKIYKLFKQVNTSSLFSTIQNIDIKKFLISTYYGFFKPMQYYFNKCYKSELRFAIHIDNELLFRENCKNGKLKIIKWLWNLSNTINKPFNDFSFFELDNIDYCFLYKHNGINIIDIHTNNDDAFYYSLINKKLEVANWLYEITKKTDKQIKLQLFQIIELNKINDQNINYWLKKLDIFVN